MKRRFWTAFSLTLAVYLLGIAAAVWVIDPPEAPAAEPVREAVQYSPDPEEDLILLGVVEGEEPTVLLMGFFPVQERIAVLALTGEEVPVQGISGLRTELEAEYGLTVDAWLSGEPEAWRELVQGMGAATLTLSTDSTVSLDGEEVILRAGRQRLDSRLSMALIQSGSSHTGELTADWCRVFCRSAEELGAEELFTRLSGGFDTSLSYAAIARHLQGLGWLGSREAPAEAASVSDPAGITALFARSAETDSADLSISDKSLR